MATKDTRITVPVTISVARSTLIGLLVNAVEGGSNYWASFSQAKPSGSDYDRVFVREFDAHGDKPALAREVTAEELAVGLARLMASPSPFATAHTHASDALNEDGDATTADVVLQMTVFGDVIYG